jgi:hypothetical protein
MQNSKNTLRLVASVIFFVVGAIALWSKTFSSLNGMNFLFGNGSLHDLFAIQAFSANLLLFPACLALGVIGVLQGRDKLLFWGAISIWIYCIPLIWVSTVMLNGFDVLISYPVDVLLGYQVSDQAITLGLTAATGLVVLANQQPKATPVQEQSVAAQPGMATESPMPILALVGALLFPIIGIVLGHMSLSQMRAGTMSSKNRGLAQAALFISYIYIAIVIFAIIMLFVAIANWQNQY